MNKDLKAVANFLYEAGMLAKTPRSGLPFLGSGRQSVAEHLNRAAYIGFALAKMHGKADPRKVMQMCLFHDFAEARTSDLNYISQKYSVVDEERALKDMAEKLPFGEDILEIVEEYEERESIESILTKEADILELLIFLKEQLDTGNPLAKDWITASLRRLKTDQGKELAEVILDTGMDEWWFDRSDDYWVHRNKEN